MKNKLKIYFLTPIDPSYIVMILRSIALILVISILGLITNDFEHHISLIGALGILISALLASYSVILNIDSNVGIKNREHSDKIRFIFFKLCLIKTRLSGLNAEKQRDTVSFMDIERMFDTMTDIKTMLSESVAKESVSIMHNNVLTELHFLLAEIYTMSTAIQSMMKNIKRPDPTASTQPVYRNPLNQIDLKIDDSIAKLTNLLGYLKEGYSKDFKQDGGIEGCADYEKNLAGKIDATGR